MPETVTRDTSKAEAIELLHDRLPETVHVFVEEESDQWLAHVLEFDLVGHGDTEKDALDSALGLIQAHLAAAIELGEVEGLVPRMAPLSVRLRLHARLLEARVRQRLSRGAELRKLFEQDLPRDRIERDLRTAI